MEEAEEVCDASTPKDIAWEVADLLFFAMTKCIANRVSISRSRSPTGSPSPKNHPPKG
jgi:phosphoribosyl-ATP pyrophosphohydrolase